MNDDIEYLKGGFRPFFTASAAWAVIAIAIFAIDLFFNIPLHSKMDIILWHRHEMIFGFAGAAIAGFLLTAIPNWTGCKPISAKNLGILVFVWCLARVANLFSEYLGFVFSISFDIGFFLVLGTYVFGEIRAAKNRNIPIALMVFLLAIAALYDHLRIIFPFLSPLWGSYFAIGVIVIMVSLIGGRIIPAFTKNYLHKKGVEKGLPIQANKFDGLVIIFTAVALQFWIFAGNKLAGWLMIIAAVLQFIRFIRWSGYKCLDDALVWILHLAYLMLPIGIGAIGFSLLGYMPPAAGVHTITIGAMGMMILAVMTRASLGHTGRALKASPLAVMSYFALFTALIFRFLATIIMEKYPMFIGLAAIFWIIAFTLFLIEYVPYFASKRADGK